MLPLLRVCFILFLTSDNWLHFYLVVSHFSFRYFMKSFSCCKESTMRSISDYVFSTVFSSLMRISFSLSYWLKLMSISLFFSNSSLVALMYFFSISETSILAFSRSRFSKTSFYSFSFFSFPSNLSMECAAFRVTNLSSSILYFKTKMSFSIVELLQTSWPFSVVIVSTCRWMELICFLRKVCFSSSTRSSYKKFVLNVWFSFCFCYISRMSCFSCCSFAFISYRYSF